MPAWRKINSTKEGTSSMYSAADYNKVMDLLNGVDTGQAVDINNNWNFTRTPTGITSAGGLGAYFHVYKSGANWVCVKVRDGSTVSTNTDAATTIQYALNNAQTNGKVLVDAEDGVISLSTPLTLTHWTTLAGSGREATSLRPSGDFPAIIVNSKNGTIQDLFLSHAQVGYTSSLLKFIGNASEVNVINCDIYDGDTNAGTAIELMCDLALNWGDGQTANNFFAINTYGFLYAVKLTCSNGGNWINGNVFNSCAFFGCKHVLQSAGAVNSTIDQNVFLGCSSQNLPGNPQTTPLFNLDDSASHLGTKIVGCIWWDIPGGVVCYNVNSSTELDLMAAVPDTDAHVGGSGASTMISNGKLRRPWSVNTTETMKNKTLDSTNNFSGTATSATLGSNGAVPAQVAGYITINVGGAAKKIPYYNT